MLVLTRKVGEAIDIGESRIKILSVTGNRIRIGIDAPQHINVVRTEVNEKQSKEEAV